ncbi:hypothetical protein HYV11_01135 [Candidatus Dependentiae bacterium]|nr:hypothetical protein [Candidatus Dependentiae bacterium]
MKKRGLLLLLHSFILLCANYNSYLTAAAIQTPYIPATGPLQLNDIISSSGTVTHRGIIIQSLIKNQDLIMERQHVQDFLDSQINVPRPPLHWPAYQEIIDLIRRSYTNTSSGALEAFEKTIMHIYRQKAYVYLFKTTYEPFGFYTGIRKDWLSPLSYLNPFGWTGDNDPALEQLINEMDQLANIATGIKPILGIRMKATIHNYKHWRKYLLSTAILSLITAYTLKNYGIKPFINVKDQAFKAIDNAKKRGLSVFNWLMQKKPNTDLPAASPQPSPQLPQQPSPQLPPQPSPQLPQQPSPQLPQQPIQQEPKLLQLINDIIKLEDKQKYYKGLEPEIGEALSEIQKQLTALKEELNEMINPKKSSYHFEYPSSFQPI